MALHGHRLWLGIEHGGTRRNWLLLRPASWSSSGRLLLGNPPFNNGFVVGNPRRPFRYCLSAAPATAAAANAAFLTGFASGGTLQSIGAANPFFAPPSFYNPGGSLHAPQYQEWNLRNRERHRSQHNVFRQLCWQPWAARDLGEISARTVSIPAALAAFHLTAPDPRFSTVQELQTSAVSNYNGVTVSLSRRLRASSSSSTTPGATPWMRSPMAVFSEFFNFGDNISILTPEDPSQSEAVQLRQCRL